MHERFLGKSKLFIANDVIDAESPVAPIVWATRELDSILLVGHQLQAVNVVRGMLQSLGINSVMRADRRVLCVSKDDEWSLPSTPLDAQDDSFGRVYAMRCDQKVSQLVTQVTGSILPEPLPLKDVKRNPGKVGYLLSGLRDNVIAIDEAEAIIEAIAFAQVPSYLGVLLRHGSWEFTHRDPQCLVQAIRERSAVTPISTASPLEISPLTSRENNEHLTYHVCIEPKDYKVLACTGKDGKSIKEEADPKLVGSEEQLIFEQVNLLRQKGIVGHVSITLGLTETNQVVLRSIRPNWTEGHTAFYMHDKLRIRELLEPGQLGPWRLERRITTGNMKEGVINCLESTGSYFRRFGPGGYVPLDIPQPGKEQWYLFCQRSK